MRPAQRWTQDIKDTLGMRVHEAGVWQSGNQPTTFSAEREVSDVPRGTFCPKKKGTKCVKYEFELNVIDDKKKKAEISTFNQNKIL